jgi:hypothetical protein
MSQQVVDSYLDLMDAQRESAWTAIQGLSEDQVWQRPGPGQWSIGEILSHTARFLNSFTPLLFFMWKAFRWWGQRRRHLPYKTDIENVYQRPNFPMWTGFLWKPRHTPENPASLAELRDQIETVHATIREFYNGKDPGVLGHINAWDPAIGVVNLITGLKVCIDHDQLHYDDVIAQAADLGQRCSPPPD